MKNDEYRIKENASKFAVQKFYCYETSLIWYLLPLKVWFKKYYTPWFKEPVRIYRDMMKNGEFKFSTNDEHPLVVQSQSSYTEASIFDTKKEALDAIEVMDFISKSRLEVPKEIYHTVNN